MKKVSLLLLLCLVTTISKAQDIDALLAAGKEDAQRFANNYLEPATNGLMYSMNANWFNTAHSKPLLGFEISIVTNASAVKNENKTFLMDTNQYNNIQFVQGGNAQQVSTALGNNNNSRFVEIQYKVPNTNTILKEQVELPVGLLDKNINLLPTAFIQGSLGLVKGIEIKARFLPKINTDDISLSMYGAAVQFEITKWLPANKLLPIAISGLVAYTCLDGSYDLTDASGFSGENQRVKNETNTVLLQLIASTKLPIINFYAGLGYIKGKSDSDVLGTYKSTNARIIPFSETDPFSVSSKVASVRGTVGARLKLGFFRLNAEYHLSEFDTYSVGLSFGIR